MSTARSVEAIVSTSGGNCSKYISPYAEKIEYTDSAEGSGDDLSITLNDRDGKFIGSWRPEKGMYLGLSIYTKNWNGDGDNRKFNCGSFLVDDVSYSGPPSTCTIDGISVPQDQDFRSTKVTKTWEQNTVSGIVGEIAGKYGLGVSFEGNDAPIVQLEQNGRTDCAFINQIANAYGNAMKVYSNKVVIYSIEDYEGAGAGKTIKKSDCENYSFRDSIWGTYTGANVSFTDPNDEQDYAVMIGGEGRMYEMNPTADNLGDLQAKGIAALNIANRQTLTATLRIFPKPGICAGQTVKLSGFGGYSGKYFVDKVKHTITGSGMYTQTLSVHMVQDWISSVSILPVVQFPLPAPNTVTYTVKKGDTLWGIAKQILGSGIRYIEIYNQNQAIIESTAQARMKKDSDRGHWIFPGETFTITVTP